MTYDHWKTTDPSDSNGDYEVCTDCGRPVPICNATILYGHSLCHQCAENTEREDERQ
jgi:RNA polymerase-binding transcription factor DksA